MNCIHYSVQCKPSSLIGVLGLVLISDITREKELGPMKVLILGAGGQIARVATDLFLKNTNASLTLYLRNAGRLKISGYENRVQMVEGDVLDQKKLDSAVSGQNVVYANLSGAMEQQARTLSARWRTTKSSA